MIVVADNSGRLCNRLVLFAHACATALDSGQSFCHLMAKDAMRFAQFAPETLREFRVSIVSKIPVLGFMLRCRQAFYERVRPFDEGGYKEGNKTRAEKMARRRILPHFLICWWYRNPEALVRNRDKICRLLAPREEFTVRPRMFAEDVGANGRKLVGVHVRRGDYRRFCEGRYFFSDEEYVRFMEMARTAISERCVFVMVSDEPLNEGFFRAGGLDAHVFRGDDFSEDLVMLSLCDYVMGPWSTFSWWAAFYGGGRLCHLHSRDDVVGAGSFRAVTGQEV